MSASQFWIARGCGIDQPMQGDSLVAAAPDAPVVRVGEGAPDNLPAPVLPQGGNALAGFEQETPADIVPALVRLWIAGYLADRPNWDGVICAVTADISHWVHVSAGEAISSQSFVTPRLIAVMAGGDTPDAEAMADSLSRPAHLAARLREAELAQNPAAVTGHLIGAELAAARAYWLGQEIAVTGDNAVAAGYEAGLVAQGCAVARCSSEELAGKGLGALGRALGYAVS